MEDFDANIEDQKEENRKDAEEEESELVGNAPATFFFNIIHNRVCTC